MITSSWRENDVATSFWRRNDVIFYVVYPSGSEVCRFSDIIEYEVLCSKYLK